MKANVHHDSRNFDGYIDAEYVVVTPSGSYEIRLATTHVNNDRIGGVCVTRLDNPDTQIDLPEPIVAAINKLNSCDDKHVCVDAINLPECRGVLDRFAKTEAE